VTFSEGHFLGLLSFPGGKFAPMRSPCCVCVCVCLCYRSQFVNKWTDFLIIFCKHIDIIRDLPNFISLVFQFPLIGNNNMAGARNYEVGGLVRTPDYE